jgi:chromosome segregation ATPase
MKEELLQAQQIIADREAAHRELETHYAEALQRIASMERAQRTVEEEIRNVKMAARQSLPAAVDDGQITSLKEKIIRLENELQQMKCAACVPALPVANKRVSLDSMSADELKSNYETLSIRNDLVQEELQRVQGICERLQDEVVRFRVDAAADRDACSSLQLSLSNEKAASDALERSLHALQSELSTVYSKLQDHESNGSSLQRLEQDMKKMQQQAVCTSEQLRSKEVALLDVQRKLAEEHARRVTMRHQITRCKCLIVYCRCEKLQSSCEEAVISSEKHQVALTKQMEANKVLDNDLKMMCGVNTTPQCAHACILRMMLLAGTASTRRTLLIWKTSTSATTTAAATRAPPRVPLCGECFS